MSKKSASRSAASWTPRCALARRSSVTAKPTAPPTSGRSSSCARRRRSQGLWNPHLPAEWDGMGLGPVAMAFVSAEAGRTGIGPFVINAQAPDEGNMHTLLHWATDDQKERYLRPLAEGRSRSCFAMTEPEVAGSDPTLIQTQRGEGRRRLGDQRAQVVHLRREGRAVRHPHRLHRSRGRPAAGPQLGLPRRPARPGLRDRPRHRHDARPRQPLRDPHQRPPRPGRPDARRPGRGSPPRPVPARPGAARALHALDRQRRDRPRDARRPRAQPLRSRLAISRRSRRSSG